MRRPDTEIRAVNEYELPQDVSGDSVVVTKGLDLPCQAARGNGF